MENGSVKIPVQGEADEDSTSQQTSLEEKVEAFVTEHPEGWTFEEESDLIEKTEGFDDSLSDVAASIEESLHEHIGDVEQSVPPMLQELSSEEPTLEEEAALLELSSRRPEVEAAARDYLLVGSTTDMEDMNTFILSLSNHGFSVELVRVQDAIRTIIMETSYRHEQEKMHSQANQVHGQNGKRFDCLNKCVLNYENVFLKLLLVEKATWYKHAWNLKKKQRSLGLDLKSPAVSGRLHALFDLHLEISEAEELQDPSVARRNRMLRILYHGAVHLPDEVRRTIERFGGEIYPPLSPLLRPYLNRVKETFQKLNKA